jgi:outer membrane protein TolC
MRNLAVMAALTAVSGCMVGPDFVRPTPPAVEGYTPEPLATRTAAADTVGGVSQYFHSDRDIPGQWWLLFRSEPLNSLIEHALKANPDLQAAQAALRQARENVYAGEGALFPTVQANGSAQRQRQSGATFGQDTPASTFNLYNASVGVSYVADVFGGTRRNIESLQAQAENQRFQRPRAISSTSCSGNSHWAEHRARRCWRRPRPSPRRAPPCRRCKSSSPSSAIC